MPPISDPLTLARIRSLNTAVEEGAVAVRAAHAAASEAETRKAALRDTKAAHLAAEPKADPDLAAALSERLAADPTAAAGADWSAQLRESNDAAAAAVRDWNAEGSVLDQALARLDAELGTHREALASAKGEHERRWAAFVMGAREAMVAEFERQFAGFYAAVLGPMDGLKAAKRLYSAGQVVSGPQRGLMHESMLVIGCGGTMERKLYPLTDVHAADASLTAFRAALAEPETPAPRSRLRG